MNARYTPGQIADTIAQAQEPEVVSITASMKIQNPAIHFDESKIERLCLIDQIVMKIDIRGKAYTTFSFPTNGTFIISHCPSEEIARVGLQQLLEHWMNYSGLIGTPIEMPQIKYYRYIYKAKLLQPLDLVALTGAIPYSMIEDHMLKFEEHHVKCMICANGVILFICNGQENVQFIPDIWNRVLPVLAQYVID
jgi:hypothetical protein